MTCPNCGDPCDGLFVCRRCETKAEKVLSFAAFLEFDVGLTGSAIPTPFAFGWTASRHQTRCLKVSWTMKDFTSFKQALQPLLSSSRAMSRFEPCTQLVHVTFTNPEVLAELSRRIQVREHPDEIPF
jgi:hypothetical protein